jgi:translation initiation factor 1 (eIF-1/SUI1)
MGWKVSKKRSDLRGDGNPLAGNPFGGLAERRAALPQASVPDRIDDVTRPSAATSPYSVGKTRKGGLPVFVEKRAKGKTVTVVRNVTGDAEALLTLLKKRCGAGGVVRDGEVEIQGDHRAAVEAILRAL